MTTMQTQCTLAPADAPAASSSPLGKRKADTQDNERLSKRLSLLNLGMCYIELLYCHAHANSRYREKRLEIVRTG